MSSQRKQAWPSYVRRGSRWACIAQAWRRQAGAGAGDMGGLPWHSKLFPAGRGGWRRGPATCCRQRRAGRALATAGLTRAIPCAASPAAIIAAFHLSRLCHPEHHFRRLNTDDEARRLLGTNKRLYAAWRRGAAAASPPLHVKSKALVPCLRHQRARDAAGRQQRMNRASFRLPTSAANHSLIYEHFISPCMV